MQKKRLLSSVSVNSQSRAAPILSETLHVFMQIVIKAICGQVSALCAPAVKLGHFRSEGGQGA